MKNKAKNLSQFKSTYPILFNEIKDAIKQRNIVEYVAENVVNDLIFPLEKQPSSYFNQCLEKYERLPFHIKFAISKLTPFPITEKTIYDAKLAAEWNDNYYQVLAEPVLELFGKKSSPYAWISINSYGSKVLNTRNVMFLDIDTSGEHAITFSEVQALKQIESVVNFWRETENRELCFFVFETAAGLRAIEVNELHDPNAGTTQMIMRQCFCDPAYVKLCWKQNSFRARLTAKYWRTNCGDIPDENVCNFVGTIGNHLDVEKKNKEIEIVKKLHSCCVVDPLDDDIELA